MFENKPRQWSLLSFALVIATVLALFLISILAGYENRILRHKVELRDERIAELELENEEIFSIAAQNTELYQGLDDLRQERIADLEAIVGIYEQYCPELGD